jgi:hypothetical protein
MNTAQEILGRAIARVALRLRARRAAIGALAGAAAAAPAAVWLAATAGVATGAALALAGACAALAATGALVLSRRSRAVEAEAAARLDAAYGLDDLIVSARAATGPLAPHVVSAAAAALRPHAPWRTIAPFGPTLAAATAAVLVLGAAAVVRPPRETDAQARALRAKAPQTKERLGAEAVEAATTAADPPRATRGARRDEPTADETATGPDETAAGPDEPAMGPREPATRPGETAPLRTDDAAATRSAGAAAAAPGADDAPRVDTAVSRRPTATRLAPAAPEGDVLVATPAAGQIAVPEAVPPRYRRMVADFLARRAE